MDLFISPTHPYERRINKAVETWCLHLPSPVSRLTLILHIPKTINAILMLYDPEKNYLGEIMQGSHQQPLMITLSAEPSCYFASTVSPVPAFICFRMLTDPATFPVGGYPLNLSCLMDDADHPHLIEKPTPMLSPLFLPNGSTSASVGSDCSATVSEKPRYYKGDLHGHTTLSDGSLTPQAALSVLAQQKLDFMAFTEHNRVAQWFPLSSTHLIPSVELTFQQGHVNIHGLSHPAIFDNLSGDSPFSLADIVEWNTHPGTHVCVNHPFMEPWHFIDDTLLVSQVQSLEILCDPTYAGAHTANHLAVDFWDHLWNQGYRLYGVGGSDSHQLPSEPYEGALLPSLFGDPATHVAARNLTTASLIDGLQQGHSFVSRYIALSVGLQPEPFLPGDRIPDTVKAVTWAVTVTNFEQSPVLPAYWAVVYLNGQPYHQQRLTADQPSFEITIPVTGDTGYSRISLLDEQHTLHAFTNPVHWGHPHPPDRPLGHLIKEFFKRDQRRSFR